MRVLMLAASIAAFAPDALTAQDARAARSSPVDQLAWLAGCWERVSGATVVEEQWMAPRGGMMLGMGRTVVGGRVREYEMLRVFEAGDTLVYGSTPSGQAYAEFRAPTIGDRSVVFENRSHDFPQRIGYRAIRSDSLIAFIEGPRGGTVRRIEFPYARVACPTG